MAKLIYSAIDSLDGYVADRHGYWESAKDSATTARTRIEREFNPETIRQMTASADQDITRGKGLSTELKSSLKARGWRGFAMSYDLCPGRTSPGR